MTTLETKALWKAANEALSLIEDERAALVAATDERYRAAKERLEEIEDECGSPIFCEGCSEPIFDDDPYLGGETPLCTGCAPTFADLLTEPEGFADLNGEPLTPEAARAWYERHIAAGGKPTDSMAQVRQ